MASIGLNEVADGILQRWQAAGLASVCVGGFTIFDKAERSVKPYAYLGGEEGLRRLTSKGRYDEVLFQIEIIGTNKQVRPVIAKVKDALGEQPLPLTAENNAVSVSLILERVTYVPEVTYVRAVMEYAALIRQDRVRVV